MMLEAASVSVPNTDSGSSVLAQVDILGSGKGNGHDGGTVLGECDEKVEDQGLTLDSPWRQMLRRQLRMDHNEAARF